LHNQALISRLQEFKRDDPRGAFFPQHAMLNAHRTPRAPAKLEPNRSEREFAPNALG
jgi:hypothetical protein